MLHFIYVYLMYPQSTINKHIIIIVKSLWIYSKIFEYASKRPFYPFRAKLSKYFLKLEVVYRYRDKQFQDIFVKFGTKKLEMLMLKLTFFFPITVIYSSNEMD